MKSVICTMLAVFLLGFASTACSKKAEPAPTPPKASNEHDEHAAPHGGELVELAGGSIHVEFIHDEAAGTLVVHLFDGAMKPIMVTEVPVLNLKTAGGPKQMSGVAATQGAAGSSQWNFRDDALKGHPEDARLRVSVAGKTYNPEVPHHH